MRRKLRAKSVNANAWDKLSNQGYDRSFANRDVHSNQQMDRSKFLKVRSKAPGYVTGWILGTVVFILTWIIFSAITVGLSVMNSSGGSSVPGAGEYYEQTEDMIGDDLVACYQGLTERGLFDNGKCYVNAEDVPVPQWYKDRIAELPEEPVGQEPQETKTIAQEIGSFGGFKLFLSLGMGFMVGALVGGFMIKRVSIDNVMNDTSDINQYENDQHIALVEEVQTKYDIFPDAGAHSNVRPNSLLSHMMLSNKGLNKVRQTKFAQSDILDEDGEVLYYKGDPLRDEEGRIIVEEVPAIDEQFGQALYDASGMPKEKSLRKFFDARQIPYNPGNTSREKLRGFATVADLINEDWDLPPYETQRPAGAYVVDTAPVNTMVLAITRGGKGQTYIEPMVDMWSREKDPSNMVVNDPKGELLVNNYIPLVKRGHRPVQFNLINPRKTDIYNPLGLAADAARQGDFQKCAEYVENVGKVFFPADGGDDPVWPNAANNAFKRAAYGLIDFYLEEEHELRAKAAAVNMEPEVLEQQLDDMWSKVSLYNCYQMFVQLTAKKMKNPEAELEQRMKAGEFDDNEDELEAEREKAAAKAFLWEGKPELDMLTLYFNATNALPNNSMRTQVSNSDNALRAMASAEKMLASVYGIAITAMSFFTDPTISRLTSGKPSQNTDLTGFSFPRRIGVRFAQNYLERDNLVGQQAVWSAYSDSMFTENLGKDFTHQVIMGDDGWAWFYFKGIFPANEAWVKLELVNPQTKMLSRTFYFHFKKGYQLSLNKRHFVKEPVTGQKLVTDGVLRELVPVREGGKRDGKILKFVRAHTTFPQQRLDVLTSSSPEIIEVQTRAIMNTWVKYSEQTKALFLVTPPHLASYAKLILILVKQLFDVSVGESYMTKSNQKPLYRTRYMLDELGNLQSEGKGIDGFQTMLSIGLGQEQQYTLILQTLQQLRDVYGESVDKIVQGNTSNIIFLKSTDDSMLDTLEKLSGTTHRPYRDSKQVSQDLDKMVGGKTDGRVSYTISVKEEPLIKFNDLVYLPERNSIVFRAGDAPIWNRNETILPMSWRLLRENAMRHPGNDYSLQTIPTLSSAAEFDVRKNQPDFRAMLDKRILQAKHAEHSMDLYRESFGFKPLDIEKLDPDVYSADVMELVRHRSDWELGVDPITGGLDPVQAEYTESADYGQTTGLTESDNEDLLAAKADADAKIAELSVKRYADGELARDSLVRPDGVLRVGTLDVQICEAYRRTMVDFEHDTKHFRVGADGELRSTDGSTVYLRPQSLSSKDAAMAKLNESAQADGQRVYAEGELDGDAMSALLTMEVTEAFYGFLASQDTWRHLADGEFDRAMAVELRRD